MSNTGCWECHRPAPGGVCPGPHPRFSFAKAIDRGDVLGFARRIDHAGERRFLRCPVCSELIAPERRQLDKHVRRHIWETLNRMRELERAAIAEGVTWAEQPSSAIRRSVLDIAGLHGADVAAEPVPEGA